MLRPIPRRSGKTYPFIIDERREWMREHYQPICPLRSRSEPIKLVITTAGCAGVIDELVRRTNPRLMEGVEDACTS